MEHEQKKNLEEKLYPLICPIHHCVIKPPNKNMNKHNIVKYADRNKTQFIPTLSESISNPQENNNNNQIKHNNIQTKYDIYKVNSNKLNNNYTNNYSFYVSGSKQISSIDKANNFNNNKIKGPNPSILNNDIYTKKNIKVTKELKDLGGLKFATKIKYEKVKKIINEQKIKNTNLVKRMENYVKQNENKPVVLNDSKNLDTSKNNNNNNQNINNNNQNNINNNQNYLSKNIITKKNILSQNLKSTKNENFSKINNNLKKHITNITINTTNKINRPTFENKNNIKRTSTPTKLRNDNSGMNNNNNFIHYIYSERPSTINSKNTTNNNIKRETYIIHNDKYKINNNEKYSSNSNNLQKDKKDSRIPKKTREYSSRTVVQSKEINNNSIPESEVYEVPIQPKKINDYKNKYNNISIKESVSPYNSNRKGKQYQANTVIIPNNNSDRRSYNEYEVRSYRKENNSTGKDYGKGNQNSQKRNIVFEKSYNNIHENELDIEKYEKNRVRKRGDNTNNHKIFFSSNFKNKRTYKTSTEFQNNNNKNYILSHPPDNRRANPERNKPKSFTIISNNYNRNSNINSNNYYNAMKNLEEEIEIEEDNEPNEQNEQNEYEEKPE